MFYLEEWLEKTLKKDSKKQPDSTRILIVLLRENMKYLEQIEQGKHDEELSKKITWLNDLIHKVKKEFED
jgi:hypothetical protein